MKKKFVLWIILCTLNLIAQSDRYFCENPQSELFITGAIPQFQFINPHPHHYSVREDSVQVSFHFDQPVSDFAMVDSLNLFSGDTHGNWQSLLTCILNLPVGQYTMYILNMSDEIDLLKTETYDLGFSTTPHYIEVHVPDCENYVTLQGVDASAVNLPNDEHYSSDVIYQFTENDWCFSGRCPFSVYGFSNLEGTFSFSEGYVRCHRSVLIYYDEFTGLQDDVTLSNDPDDFIVQDVELYVPPLSCEMKKKVYLAFPISYDSVLGYSLSIRDEAPIASSEPWIMELQMMNENYLQHSGKVYMEISQVVQPYDESLMHSQFISCVNDSITVRLNIFPTEIDIPYEQNQRIELGYAPYIPWIWFRSWENTHYLYAMINDLSNVELVTLHPEMGYVRIYNENNQIVLQGTCADVWATNLPATGGPYRVEIDQIQREIDGIQTSCEVQTWSDPGSDRPNTPILEALQITSNQHSHGYRHSAQDAISIYVQIVDCEYRYEHIPVAFYSMDADSVSIAVKSHEQADWMPLSHEFVADYVTSLDMHMGTIYKATIPANTLPDSTTCDLLLRFADANGNWTRYMWSNLLFIGDAGSTGVVLNPHVPENLLSNHPNPFNPTTEICFSLSSELNDGNEPVAIEIFNIRGQMVKTLPIDINKLSSQPSRARGDLSSSTTWDGTDSDNRHVASGLYFYQLKVGSKSVAQKKMMLLK